ncbi:MAG: MATE family efflux transporter [Acidobacteriota bacterium]
MSEPPHQAAATDEAATTPDLPPDFWRDVRDSIRGVQQSYTSLSINRAIALLAIPMVLEMAMQSLFSVVDVYFVAKLGSDPIAILGLADSLQALVFAVSMGLCMGTAAMVARRIGEKDPAAAASAAVQAIMLGTVVSVAFGVLGALFAVEALQLLGASPELAADGALFTAILLGTNITVMLLFLINAVFRGAGDPALAMRALWLANGINIVLDPLLIFGWGPIPALGLEGAAIATAIGRTIGIVYQLRLLTNGSSQIRIERHHWRPQIALMLRLARVSGIGILQFLISTASFLGLVKILAVFGDVALAGYTLAVRIIIFILLPAWGMGNAAATLVGQNLGAGDPERAEKSVWRTGVFNMLFMGCVAVVFQLFAEPLMAFFTDDTAVALLAAECLLISSYSYVFWAFGMIMVLSFNGAGDTTTPTWINFFVYWLFQLPVAWALAHPLGIGPTGVFIAVALSQTLLAVVGTVMFKRGTWKTRVI